MLEKLGQKKKTADDLKKPSLRERLEKDQTLRIIIIFLSILIYLYLFLFIYFSSGMNMSIAGIIPAVTIGWLFGFIPGILAGVLALPLNLLMRIIFVGEIWDSGFTVGTALAGSGAILLNSAIVGKIRDLGLTYKQKLNERKLAEMRLTEHGQKLDKQKQKLTEINKDLEKASIERKNTVEKLSETKDTLKDLMETSLDPILICDSMGNIIKPNQAFCEMVGYCEEEVVGKMTTSFTPNSTGKYTSITGEEISLNEAFINNALNSIGILFKEGKISDWKAYMFNKNNELIPTINSAVCLYDEQGDHASSFIVLRDITEQRKAEMVMIASKEEAEKANLSKNLFLTNMSHEIRTPMNGVIGFTDILLNSGLDSEQKDYVFTIKRSGEALLSLIDDILDFSKIESGKFTVKEIDFDVELLAHDVCELIRPKLSEKNIEILCRIEENVPSQISCDPYRFRQVLINLMGNAAKFTKKGEIELSIDIEDKKENKIKLHTIIKDTGIGIPKDKINSIFKVFHQADSSTTRKYGGTGLGLSICKKIATDVVK